MRRRTRWLKTTIPVLMLALGLVSQREALACAMAPALGFESLGNRIVVDPSMTEADREQALRRLERARARVTTVFGPLRGTPRIVIVPDDARRHWFVGNPTAGTHYSPLGAMVVLGPDGQNDDVFSHELAHAELFARLGWWAMNHRLPRWLDEGLAMQVDTRENVDDWYLQVKGEVAKRLEHDTLERLCDTSSW